MIDNVRKLDKRVLLNQIINDPIVNAQIIDANQYQWNRGLEADGTFMGNYSNVSVTKYGKSPGPIKLKDTGATRESMKVVIQGDGFVMHADMDLHGTDLTERFPKALGLTSESISDLQPEIKERLIERVRNEVLKR